MQTPNVLIVEDEVVTRTTLKSLFEAEGYNVFEAENGDQMHDFFENHAINLVIMDINLPGKNGLILAREVRDRKNVGLIFLTGRDNDVDRILGLEIGADDYLTKPFNPRELTIRARNLLSRTTNSAEDDDLPSRVNFNGWMLDGDSTAPRLRALRAAIWALAQTLNRSSIANDCFLRHAEMRGVGTALRSAVGTQGLT